MVACDKAVALLVRKHRKTVRDCMEIGINSMNARVSYLGRLNGDILKVALYPLINGLSEAKCIRKNNNTNHTQAQHGTTD